MRLLATFFLIMVFAFCGGCILDSGDERYSVSGTICTQAGDALSGIPVCLGEMAVVTGSNGSYKFTNIEYGSYYIEADPYDYYSAEYRFEPGGQKIAVTENKKINFTAYPR